MFQKFFEKYDAGERQKRGVYYTPAELVAYIVTTVQALLREQFGDDWGFALYDPATETYEPSVLPGGQPFGSAAEAYDAAAIVHLTEYAE